MFMEVAAMFLHNARSGACPGWVINGCNNVETEKINAVFSRHIDYEQDAGFNEWRISKVDDSWFSVYRFTWERGFYGTLDKVLGDIDKYYTEIEDRRKSNE